VVVGINAVIFRLALLAFGFGKGLPDRQKILDGGTFYFLLISISIFPNEIRPEDNFEMGSNQ